MNNKRSLALSGLPTWRPARMTLSTESLALIVSIFFVLACNSRFWNAALAGRDGSSAETLLFVGTVGFALVGIHFLMLCLVLTRWSARPLLAVLIVVTAFATYYMDAFSVYMDPNMLRNVLATEVKEAGDLLVRGMVLHLALYAGLPLLVLWHIRPMRRSMPRALLIRLGAIAGGVIVTVGAVMLSYQDLSSLMRNHKEVRYLITPANYIYSMGRVLTARTQLAGQVRAVVGPDARLAADWTTRKKPVLFVMVVGETARAANWGLNGYSRQTTPELAELDVINFSAVTACGTDTETSLPCMFSAIGRRDYDEGRIRGSDSLLHLLRRAGFDVIWRDNNTGCKGVCAGLREERVDNLVLPGLCEPDLCLDGTLLDGMDAIARDSSGNLFVVLHQLGNHGPSYYRRYPDRFRRFTPTCDTAELRHCDRQEIVNSYDNALLYTDHFLAATISFLKSQATRYDSAMLFVSDHGESLGEKGLYLHGIPYAIAPGFQTAVPMVLWFSPEFKRSFGVDEECFRAKARRPASHDNLFHSILGILHVESATLDPVLNLSQGCNATASPKRQG